MQFEKNSYTNRNIVYTPNGPAWLTIPVKTKGKFKDIAIKELEIDNSQKWRKKHWDTIYQSYNQTPYFSEHKNFFKSVYTKDWEFLFDLNREVNNYILSALNIQTKLVYSSDLNLERKKDELVLELCQKSDATTYLSGALGRSYLNEEAFKGKGINVVYQDYKHPHYKQENRKKFEHNIAVIDLLFNSGSESIEIILSGNINKAKMD